MQRAALAIVVALLTVAAARSLKSGYAERVEALCAEAEAQRKQLGLDRDRKRLYAQYPTPEIAFAGRPVGVSCGKSSAIELRGAYPKGTELLVLRDDVRADSARLTATGWRATLHAQPDALPGPIAVRALAPVSCASAERQVAEVRGQLALSLEFEDGWSARVTPAPDGSHAVEWKKGSEQRSSKATVSSRPGQVRVGFMPSPEQMAQMQQRSQQMAAQAISPDLQAAIEKLQACSKLGQSEQLPCIQRLQPEMQRASEANQQRLREQQERDEAAAPKDAWACSQVELRGPPAQMEGEAQCARALRVKARVTCTPPAP